MFEVLQESFPQREERVLHFWNTAEIFARSLKERLNCPLFSFYDGPPFATGLPHYGHVLAGTIKDVIPRYKTMQGFYVPRRFGWDCHGLPIENEIEKSQGFSGAADIEAFGIAKFNEACRSIVLRYTKEWETVVKRCGRWVDFEAIYRTMDPDFMESVWWVFGKLYEKGLVYEGLKVMPFSAKLGTPLSNFEANLNYKDVDDPSLTVSFVLQDDPSVAFLVWTTTPWTLPSNLALAVGNEIVYVKVKTEKGLYILAKERLSAHFSSNVKVEILEEYKGAALVGTRYIPLFSYFVERGSSHDFQVLSGEFVSLEDGTGIVHLAPAFGEVDFFACSAAGIEPVCPIDQNGKFTHEVKEYEGLFVKDADKEIIKRLKQEGRVFHHGQIRHRYPFCWRSDTPLIYKAVKTWFVAVEELKERMLVNNQLIHWVPEHIKDGRFGKWLEQARDWAISRNRYWGTPIPIWRSPSGKIIVISSIEELEKRSGLKVEDLHRHFIDDITFRHEGEEFKRITEVFDCWFESGSMPYAQNHYPFENREETLAEFPADFIGEGLDQTRGWFYTLHVLATALFDKPAFTHVVVNGIILAEDGAKMSKRLKNYPEPQRVLDEYGADAVRLFLMSSQAVIGDDLRFSEKGLEHVLRQALIPFWNGFVFLSTYAKIYGWVPEENPPLPEADIDRWILSSLQKLIQEVTEALEECQLQKGALPLMGFIEGLTNWYIRRCRSRFWSSEESQDRNQAFQTLYTVLKECSLVAAPFIPFLTEAIYQQLKQEKDPQSIHLCSYPKAKELWRDLQLELDMELTQSVVSNAHALRKEHKLKVRQPLKKAHLVSADPALLTALERHAQLIKEELNVHELSFSSDESAFATLSCKPNFRILGKKVGPKMRAVQEKLATLSQGEIAHLLKGEGMRLEVEGELILLTSEDVSIEQVVKEGIVAKSEKGVVVALDAELTEELILEGIAREIVNKINTMRREAGFYVTDRIEVQISPTPLISQAIGIHKQYIMGEVLAQTLTLGCSQGTLWDINGEESSIALFKV